MLLISKSIHGLKQVSLMSWSVHSLFLYLAFIDVNAQNPASRMCMVDNGNEIDK